MKKENESHSLTKNGRNYKAADYDRIIQDCLLMILSASNIYEVRDLEMLESDVLEICQREDISPRGILFILTAARLGDYGTISTLSASHVRAWVREEKKRREKSNPFKNMAF